MAELRQFKLPDVGEGLTEADIVRWHVQPGDTVKVNQIIVEIETAKAVVELPSPHAGVVSSLLVTEGETVDVGTPIIAIDTGSTDTGGAGAGGANTGSAGPAPVDVPPLQTPTSADLIPPPPAEAAEPAAEETGKRQAVLVGYGVKLGSTARRPRKPAAAGRPAPAAPASPAPPAPEAPAPAPAPARPAPAPAQTQAPAALAKPPVRKLARDLGVDLAALAGTGPNGSITRDDVEAANATPPTAPAPAAAGRAPAKRAAQPGSEERVPVRGVRKHTAAAMTSSAFTAPHVTMFLEIDITETMAATARLRELPDFADVRVSPLLLVAKALLVAAARHPMVNSTWDEAAQEIVVKHYVNLGIAAATDRGLVVPSIKDAHLLTLPDLARALADLAAVARAGRSTPADLADGTISITNVGVFGVDSGTPILPPGQAAILAFGQVKDAPWVRDGQLTVRRVCTLSMSFDHRIVDGDLGAAVLRDVGAMLAEPLHMLAWS